MRRSTHILGCFLAVVIALTAQSAALARTMPDAAGQMVLCTGTGPVMVYFDEDGAPTAAPHLCPDCALSLILALDSSELELAAGGLWQRQRPAARGKSRLILRLGTPNARAPPVLI